MKTLRLVYPTPILCRVLRVSRSGYYAWLKRPPSKRAQEEGRLEAEIKAAHERTRHTCGPERLQRDLAAHGVKVGIFRIRRIRKKLGMRCKQGRKFKATTDSRHSLPVAPNLLEQHFEVEAPNQVWVSDITYIPTEEGWLYCAAHKDLWNGEIVGYALGSRIAKELVEKSLVRAAAAKRPPEGLIHHSDRGSQYCSPHFQKLLARLGMKPSMSRKGNCYDNALWRASGARSRMSSFITAVTEPERRQSRRSQSTSRSSTTGKGVRRDSATCRRQHTRGNSMPGRRRLKLTTFRVHY